MLYRWICIAGLVLALGLAGCALKPVSLSRQGAFAVGRYTTAVIPPLGVLYSNVSAPAAAAVSGKGFGTKRGTATVHSIGLPPIPIGGLIMGVNLFSWGDMSEERALADGGRRTIISEPDF